MEAAGFLSRYLSGSLPCLTPYNRKYNVLSASLNKTFPSFLRGLSVWPRQPFSLTNKQRERNVLFNDTLNTFYLRLYGVRHMVKDHSDSEKGNPLPHID